MGCFVTQQKLTNTVHIKAIVEVGVYHEKQCPIYEFLEEKSSQVLGPGKATHHLSKWTVFISGVTL